jgi:hypothetical protein
VRNILSVRDIEATSLCVYAMFYRLVSHFVMIRPESLDVKGQCAYFCICLIINIKYIVARRPTTIKEYGGLNSTS